MNDPTVHNVLGSAASGIIGRIFSHPLDTVKARLQNHHSFYKGPVDAFLRTARSEGVSGLYRGFGAILVGGTPGTVLYLCGYDVFKHHLSHTLGPGEENFAVHFSSGMLAETLACTIFVPVDVIKERLQVQHSSSNEGNYRGTWDAFQKISRTEGMRGIYRGYAATLGSFGPFSALYFVFYERSKKWTSQFLAADTLPSHWIVFCSSSSGALAAWMTSPLDMAKLRLQVQRGQLARNTNDVTTNYRGVLDCLRAAYREGGVRALFRGAGARILFTVPNTTVTFTCYETCRSSIKRLLSGE